MVNPGGIHQVHTKPADHEKQIYPVRAKGNDPVNIHGADFHRDIFKKHPDMRPQYTHHGQCSQAVNGGNPGIF